MLWPSGRLLAGCVVARVRSRPFSSLPGGVLFQGKARNGGEIPEAYSWPFPQCRGSKPMDFLLLKKPALAGTYS